MSLDPDESRAISPDSPARRMKGRVIVDLHNAFDPTAMSAGGFTYLWVGGRAS